MVGKSILEDIKEHATVIYQGQPMLATNDVAHYLGVSPKTVSNRFNLNKKLFNSKVHYSLLQGDELYLFKNSKEGKDLINEHTNRYYLWTVSGVIKLSQIIYTRKSKQVLNQAMEELQS